MGSGRQIRLRSPASLCCLICMFISPVQLRAVSPEVASSAQSSPQVLHCTENLWIAFSSPRRSWMQIHQWCTMLALSPKSPFSPFPVLLFLGLHVLALLEFSFLETQPPSLPLLKNNNKTPHRPPKKSFCCLSPQGQIPQ